MRRSQRYEIISKWVQVDRYSPSDSLFADPDASHVEVIREMADIRDTQGGYVYKDGAFRVRSRKDGKSLQRAMTFYGEVAWSDSQRMFNDIVWKEKLAGDYHGVGF